MRPHLVQVRPEPPAEVDRTARRALVRCPECGQVGWVDQDQFEGTVSIECTAEGCGYHETHDLRTEGA